MHGECSFSFKLWNQEDLENCQRSRKKINVDIAKHKKSNQTCKETKRNLLNNIPASSSEECKKILSFQQKKNK